jgi:hypothetical protein
MAIVVLAASQVGHLLTTELRHGPRALSLAGTGVHAYLPALLTVALGAGGAAVLAALMVVAAARAVRTGGRASIVRPARASLLDLAAALFAVQLATYLVQETVEAAAGGAGMPSPGDLVLWGSAGQLPVAVLAALVLRWLTTSVEAAVTELAAAVGQPLAARPAIAPVRNWTAAGRALRCRPADRTATGRGPPSLLCPAG